MKRVSKLVIYGLVIVGIAIAIITTNIFPLSNWTTAIAQQRETTTPRRLNITVNVSETVRLERTGIAPASFIISK